MNKPVALWMLFTSFTLSATLEVYQDKTFYTYRSSTTFIGLSHISEARCNGQTVPIVALRECKAETVSCRDFSDLETLREKYDRVKEHEAVLSAFLSSMKLGSVSGKSWLDASEALAQERADLKQMLKNLAFDIDKTAARLKRQSNNDRPVALELSCRSDIRLTFPSGAIRFSPHYRAEISGKTVRITQELEVSNRSGVDIDADDARFYNDRASTYIRIPSFTPKILKDEPPVYFKQETRTQMPVPMMKKATAVKMPEVKKIKSREYRLSALHLPSDGLAKRFELEHYEAPVECRNELHAYAARRAFLVCRFTPRSEIESGTWWVLKNEKVLNDHAPGRYEQDKYALYVEYVKHFKIERAPYVPKKKEDGFFETVIKKKDGTVLTVTNVSDKPDSLHIVERIPVSSSDKIHVKFLALKGASDYTLEKNGELSFDASFKPFESKTFEIVYEIEHPKDVRVY